MNLAASKQETPPDVDRLLQESFGSAWQTARKIALCESGLAPSRVGDQDKQYVQGGKTYGASYGLLQVRYLPGRPEPVWLLNVRHNVAYAAGLYRAHGWTPWRNCGEKLGLL